MDRFFYDIPTTTYYYDTDDSVLTIILAVLAGILGIVLILSVFKAVCNWVIFKKAGREGWEAIIPLYNKIIAFQFLDIPMWMIIILFIPGVNVAVPIIIAINMAKKFDKDIGFAIGLIFVPIIFYPILAFGSSKYNKDSEGIFNTPVKVSDSNSRYCTNCGHKVSGSYCSNCGTKTI